MKYKKHFKLNIQRIIMDLPPYVDNSIYTYCYEWIKSQNITCILFNNNNSNERYYFYEGKLLDYSSFYKKVGSLYDN